MDLKIFIFSYKKGYSNAISYDIYFPNIHPQRMKDFSLQEKERKDSSFSQKRK
jgi:hypothetical protein